MHILLKSKQIISTFFLTTLDEKNIKCNNNQNIDCINDWHLLTIPFQGQRITIDDILINNESIKHLIYTGYFETTNGEILQPSSTLWQPGIFKIWIHPKVGLMFARIMKQITNGDYGKNLFEKYMLTVDRPVSLTGKYLNSIESFFNTGSGPYWHKKDTNEFPYKIIKNPIFETIDKNLIIKNSESQFQVISDRKSYVKFSYQKYGGEEKAHSFSLNKINCPETVKVLSAIGYKKLYHIELQYLAPKSYVPMHIDDGKNIKGCHKFYWNITNPASVYFKFDCVGLLPIQYPFFYNNGQHVHAVVNDSNAGRYVLIAY